MIVIQVKFNCNQSKPVVVIGSANFTAHTNQLTVKFIFMGIIDQFSVEIVREEV